MIVSEAFLTYTIVSITMEVEAFITVTFVHEIMKVEARLVTRIPIFATTWNKNLDNL